MGRVRRTRAIAFTVTAGIQLVNANGSSESLLDALVTRGLTRQEELADAEARLRRYQRSQRPQLVAAGPTTRRTDLRGGLGT